MRKAKAVDARGILRQLPKGELHAHVDGCCSAELWSKRVGSKHDPRFTGGSLDDFLGKYEENQLLLKGNNITSITILKSMMDTAKKNGTRYVEPCLSASFADDDFLQRLPQVEEYAKKQGVKFNLMLMAHRKNPPEKVQALMRRALDIKQRGAPVASIGCSGSGNETTLREWGVLWVQSGGSGKLQIVPHAGEMGDGSDSFQDLWAAVAINPNRVAHGVQAADDHRLSAQLSSRGICCDVAITSNELIAGVSPGQHRLPQMVRAGIPCSINTDNSLLFGCDLVSEYEKAHFSLGLSFEELAACARSSIVHSGMDEQSKSSTLSEIATWEEEYSAQLGPAYFRVGSQTPYLDLCAPDLSTVELDREMFWDKGSSTGGTAGSNQYQVVGLSKRRGWKNASQFTN